MRRPGLLSMAALGLAVALTPALVRAQPVADAAQRLEQADEAFRYQNFERAIELYEPLAREGATEDPQTRLRILERLGASQWFLGSYDVARETFADLLKLEATYELDPNYYPGELVKWFENHKALLERLGVIGRPPDDGRGPVPTPSPGRLVRTVTERRTPFVGYLMPFGVGQFANDDRTTGTVVAVLQGLGLAVNVASYFGLRANLIPGTSAVASEDAGQARLLEGLWWGGTALFVGAYGFSVADGFLNRPPARSVDERVEPLEEPGTTPGLEPAAGVHLRVLPGPGDLGLGLGATF